MSFKHICLFIKKGICWDFPGSSVVKTLPSTSLVAGSGQKFEKKKRDIYNCLIHICTWISYGQSCLTLCNPVNCSPRGSSVHGDSPGKNTGVGCHAFLQEIFPTQRPNPGLPHCRWILYRLSHQRRPIGYPGADVNFTWISFKFNMSLTHYLISPFYPQLVFFLLYFYFD